MLHGSGTCSYSTPCVSCAALFASRPYCEPCRIIFRPATLLRTSFSSRIILGTDSTNTRHCRSFDPYLLTLLREGFRQSSNKIWCRSHRYCKGTLRTSLASYHTHDVVARLNNTFLHCCRKGFGQTSNEFQCRPHLSLVHQHRQQDDPAPTHPLSVPAFI